MARKDVIEREMPQFRELEKEFHDRQESFEQTKKELVGNGMNLLLPYCIIQSSYLSNYSLTYCVYVSEHAYIRT